MARMRLRPAWLIAAAFMAAAWFLLVGPSALGGPMTYGWVDGGSMAPTLQDGDLVVARQARAYLPGDVVVFHVPRGFTRSGDLVIHRIVGETATGTYVTQGDHYDVPDGWYPTVDDVVGKLYLHIGWPDRQVLLLAPVAVLALAIWGSVGLLSRRPTR